MAPSQAAATLAMEAPLKEVLAAVGIFLNGCGLTRTAALLTQEAPLAEPSSAILVEESKRLVAVLGDACYEVTGSPVKGGKENVEPCRAKEEAWLDDLLAKALDSGVVAHAAGTNLAQNLQRSLSKGTGVTAEDAPKAGATACASAPATVADDAHSGGAVEVAAGLTEATEESSVLPPPVPLQVEPSAHYDPLRVAPVLIDGSPDEYRDDADPGYRVLAISEMELLTELHEAYRAALTEVQERTRQTEGLEGSSELVSDTAVESPPQAVPPAVEPEAAAPEAAGYPDASLNGSSEIGMDASPEVVATPSRVVLEAAPEDGAAELFREEVERQKLASLSSQPGPQLIDDCNINEGAAACAAAAEAAAAMSQISAMSGAAPNCPLPAGASAWQAQQVAPPSQADNPIMPHVLSSTKKKARRKSQQPKYRYAPSGDDFYPAEMDGVVFDSFPLRIVFERDRTGFEESKEFPIQQGSIIAARYQVLNYLGSAAFSRAVHCLDLERNEMVCMKIIKNEKDFVDQSLDEIKLLKLIGSNTDNSDNMHCVKLIDCFYHKEHLILVTELLRENLYEFSKWNREHGEAPYFTQGRLQRVSHQLLTSLEYIHSLWLIHSDLKPENILIQSYSRCMVKLIDFGSSCFVDDHLSSYVQSRSYRAPEVLLGLPYGQKIDIWSLGCVIAEIWTGYVLFQNDSVQSLLARIAGIIGPFPPTMLASGRFVPNYFTQDGRLFKELEVECPQGPDAPPPEMLRRIQLLLPKRSSLRQRMRIEDDCFEDFLTYLLKIDPAERPSAAEALAHPWLQKGRYPDGL